MTLQGLFVSFVVLLVVFRTLDYFRPKAARLRMFRRGFWTDATYWLLTPVVTRTVTRIGVAVVAAPLALLLYGQIDKEQIMRGFGPAAALPLWVQAACILTVGDFLGYWMHRWFHGRRMWKFHAVHHSSVDLDWLSSVRLHPVNDLLMRLSTVLPVLALGFAPIAVAGIVPILTLLAILVHANVDWDWGPLRSFIVSPRFHRWHHTDEREARDKNFASLLPAWDLLFGTYYMPKDRGPTQFGTSTAVPTNLLGQLLFPFRGHDRDSRPAK